MNRSAVAWGGASLSRQTLTALLFAGLVAASCSSGNSQVTSGNKTLIAETSFGIDSFDPARAASPTTIMVDHSLYDTLLVINPRDQTKPYPGLATSYTASADGTQYTFKLRQGVKFASGNPLTSSDVVWSLNRDANIQGASGAAAIVMMGLVASAPDPSTVVITASTPDPAVPVKITSNNVGILDSVLVQQHGGTNDAKDQGDTYLNSTSAGTGPYVLASADRTSQIILKANPNYWGTKPTYTTVILRNAPPATQRLDVQDGQAQLGIDISALDAASLTAASVNVIAAPSGDETYLALNNNPRVSPLTADPNFRDAVRYGLDYKGLVALAGKGSIQSSGFVPVGILGSLPVSQAPSRDLARAKASLAKVGVSNPTIELDYFTDSCQDGLCTAPFATKIQSDLKDVGITVNIVGSPLATLFPNKIAVGKVQMWLVVANPADYPDPSDFLGTAPGNYIAGYFDWNHGMDPGIDAQVNAATSAIAPTDRAAAYQTLGKSINDKEVFIYIFLAAKALVTAKSVHATLNPYWGVDFGQLT